MAPKQTILPLFTTLIGRVPAILLILGYDIFALLSIQFVLGEGAALIKIYFLPETPLLVLLFALGVLSGYAASLGLTVLARYNIFVLPTLIGTLILLSLINASHFDFDHLLPVQGNGMGGILEGTTVCLNWMGQSVVLYSLSHYVREPQRKGIAIKAVLLSSALLLLVTVSVLLVFDDYLPTLYLYPTMQMIRIFSIGNSIRGLDALIMTVWVSAVSLKAAIWFFISLHLTQEILKIRAPKTLLPLFVLLIILLADQDICSTFRMQYLLDYILPPFSFFTFMFTATFVLFAGYLLQKLKSGGSP